MARVKGTLRIVGGRFRGRRLPVPTEPGLRPTSDRVRETLFNWLAPLLPGARCLDAFAGSGALGFEAASRGAREVVLLESAAAVAAQLEANRRRLGGEGIEILHCDALRWLDGSGRAFDIVFLDPPFAEGLLSSAAEHLADGGWVRAGTRVYLEAPLQTGFPELPRGWRLVRDKRAGQVRYGLVIVDPVSAAGETAVTAPG